MLVCGHRMSCMNENNRNGILDQTMVPGMLDKKTMRLHHEGYGHMGANRMLEC